MYMNLSNIKIGSKDCGFRKVFKYLSIVGMVVMFSVSLSVIAQESPYETGQRLLDNKDYLAARDIFENLSRNKNSKQDAALYWLAFAQFKTHASHEALKTISTLRNNYADSVWLDDALALHVEIQDARGQSIDIDNDEMKLYALNSLMNSPSGRSVEILAKVLNGNNSEKIKNRALFVLSQLGEPQAYELIASMAKDDSNPNLQEQAIRMLGISGADPAIALLKDVYRASNNESAKSMVLNSYMIANHSAELLELAKLENNPNLKEQAIHLIGVMSESDVLLKMYRDADFKNFRKEILHGIAIGGDAEALYEIIKSERNENLLVEAVEKMGINGGEKASEYLLTIYRQHETRAVREAVINALFIQSNPQGLIKIVKTEKDAELKRNALQRLSMMGSDEAVDFFNDVLEN
jgi:HEAT repeat protein